MRYETVIPARFVSRPNRFVALVEPQGLPAQPVHVKNTGRCRELLTPGARVWLEKSRNPARKTAWSLVAVQKGGLLINMDSQAPNKAVGEFLAARPLPGAPGLPDLIRPEYAWGASRLDFYLEYAGRPALAEVKSVTLERGGLLLFPDAPTQRGVRHLQELARAAAQGWLTWVIFVAQMKGPARFAPNRETHPEFADALARAAAAGVRVVCYDCRVTPDSMALDAPVAVEL